MRNEDSFSEKYLPLLFALVKLTSPDQDQIAKTCNIRQKNSRSIGAAIKTKIGTVTDNKRRNSKEMLDCTETILLLAVKLI